MKKQTFPPGWDAKRIQELIAHYENQTEDEEFAEIEAAREAELIAMAKNIRRIAELLGADVVTEVPDVGGGAWGAARLAEIVQALQGRLEPGQGQRPGRPTDATWVHRAKIPMSEATARKIARLAERASREGRKVSTMQMAAQLLEEAVASIPDAEG
jgi:hypothetical protein